MPKTVKDLMFCWRSGKRRRRCRAWNLIPLALISVIWKKRDWRATEGVESSFSQVRNSLWSFIFFWCTHKVPYCIEEWVDFVKNRILQILYLLVYPLYADNQAMFINETHLPYKENMAWLSSSYKLAFEVELGPRSIHGDRARLISVVVFLCCIPILKCPRTRCPAMGMKRGVKSPTSVV